MKFRIARHTTDLNRIIDFYGRILGLKVLGDFKDCHTVHLLDNDLGLFCYVSIFDTAYVVVRLSLSNHCDGYKYMLYNNYVERTYWMKRFGRMGFEDI